MDDDVIEDKRNKLKALLFRLAEDYDDNLDRTVGDLSEIYDNGYRQMYSEIFPIISEIRNGDRCGGLDFLTGNLEYVREYVKELIQKPCDEQTEAEKAALSRCKGLYGKILKLSDHVNLEVQRLQDSEYIRKTELELSQNIEKAQKELNKMRKKVRKMQTEVVAILGIFAAIVMAMSGGLSLMGFSLEGMSSTSPYKIAFVVLLCGIVIFNMVAFLMACIQRMVDGLHDADGHGGTWHQRLSRIISDNQFLIAFNIMIIIMLLMDIICWIEFRSGIT